MYAVLKKEKVDHICVRCPVRGHIYVIIMCESWMQDN